MDFEGLLEKISPRLKRIATKCNGHGSFIDKEDLYQEMCIYLWENYREGQPCGINEAYIVKGCEFHILNYLRTEREKARIVSLEEPINEEGDTLKDVLPDGRESLDKFIDRKLVIEDIKNDGFSKREKEVFLLILQGYTIREIGKKLDVSHVMVIKHKQRIIKKWQKREEIQVTSSPKYLLSIVGA